MTSQGRGVNRAGKGVIAKRQGRGVIRAGYGNKNKMDFQCHFIL